MNRHTTKLLGTVCGVALAVSAAGLLLACDTPVYRYSMYTWDPAGYTMYVIHDGDESVAQPLMDKIAEMNSDPEGPMTNLWCVPVDISSDPHLRTVPTPVATAWDSLPEQSTPRCLLISPKGAMISSDMLAPEDLPDMVDSPKRQEIAQQLEEGKVGVFIFLADSSTPENDRALTETNAFIAALGDGVLELLTPTGPPGYQPVPGAPDSFVDVGFVRIDRDDPQEQWLIDMLLHVEDDLTEYHNQPMVFAAFGRGRVLEPYVGNGIIMENLAEGIDFIRGACSCTVRDENPGLDLLTYYNWERAATLMAERNGAEEGATRHLGSGAGQAFPQGIFPEIVPLEPSAGGSNLAPVRQLSPEVIDGGRGHGSVAGDGSTAILPYSETGGPQDGEEPAVEEVAETAEDEVEAVDSPETEVVVDTEEPPTAAEVYEESLEAEEALDEAAEHIAEHHAEHQAEEAASEPAESSEIEEVAAVTPAASESNTDAEEKPAFASSMIWTMFIGAGLGLAVLLAATFFLFRPKA